MLIILIGFLSRMMRQEVPWDFKCYYQHEPHNCPCMMYHAVRSRWLYGIIPNVVNQQWRERWQIERYAWSAEAESPSTKILAPVQLVTTIVQPTFLQFVKPYRTNHELSQPVFVWVVFSQSVVFFTLTLLSAEPRLSSEDVSCTSIFYNLSNSNPTAS